MTDRPLSQSTTLASLISSPKLLSNILAQEGDSRTQHGAAVTPGSFPSVAQYSDGLGFWIGFLSKGAVRCPAALNTAISGNTSTQILARVAGANGTAASAKAAGASAVVLFGCSTNDRTSGIALGAVGTAGTTLDNLSQIQQAYLSIGLAVIWVGETPRGSTNFSAQALTAGTILQDHVGADNWIQSQSGVRGVYVARPWKWVSDFSSTGVNLAGYISDNFAYDGLHPNGNGNYRIVKYSGLLDIVKMLFPPLAITSNQNCDIGNGNNTYGSINLNPMMIGSGGTLTGVTGTVPQSWVGRLVAGTSSTAAGVSSVTTGSDGLPVAQFVLSGTAGSTPDTFFYYQDVTSAQGLAAGQKVRMQVRVQVAAGQTGINSIYGFLIGTGGDMAYAGAAHRIGSNEYPNEAIDGVIQSDVVVTDGAYLRTGVRITTIPNTAISATIQVGPCSSRQAL